MPGSTRATESGSPARRTIVALALLIAAQFAVLRMHQTEVYSSVNGPGYFLQARLLAEHGRPWLEVQSPVQYVSDDFLPADGRYFSRYPPGLALLAAPLWRWVGPGAALWIPPLLLVLTQIPLFRLARRIMGPGFAWLACALFALNPIANYHAIHADAHTASTFFVLSGLALFERWSRRPTPGSALLAACALACAPTIRPFEALAGLGGLVFVLHTMATRPATLRQLPWLALGAALPLGALALYQTTAFGSPLATGYSLSGEQSAFGLQNFHANWGFYLRRLQRAEALPLLIPGLLGTIALCLRPSTRVFGAALLAATWPLGLGYTAYYFRWETSLRFFIPIFPLLIFAAVAWLEPLERWRRWSGAAVGAALLGGMTLTSLPAAQQLLEPEARGHRTAQIVADAVRQHIPRGSLVISNAQVLDVLDYVGGWKLVEIDLFWQRSFAPPPSGMRPAWIPDDPRPERRSAYGALDPAQRRERILRDLRAWSGDHPSLYWIAAGDGSEALRRLGVAGVPPRLEEVARIELPPVPEAERNSDKLASMALYRIETQGRPLRIFRVTPPESR